jgi:signal transduction histidine kinase
LLIEDDGVGISIKPNPGRQTFGIAGMHERIGNLGGKMKVTSARGKGTRIEVNAPVLSGNAGATTVLIPETVAQGA